MPTLTVKPGEDVRIRYPVPRNGLIEYEVEGDRPVTTFIFDKAGLEEFLHDKEYITSYYGGFPDRRYHNQEIRLPFRGWWWLVILNDDEDKSAAVHYEVFG